MECHYCYDLWSDCYKIFICKSVLCCSLVGSCVRNLPFEQIRTAVFKKIQNWGKFSSLNFDVCALSATSCSWKVDAVSTDGASKGLPDVLYSALSSLNYTNLLMTENIFWPFWNYFFFFFKYCPDILCKLWEKSVLCGCFIGMLHYGADMKE